MLVPTLRRALIFLCIGWAWALPAQAREAAVARSPAPLWAEWLPIPRPSERRLPEVEDGSYTLLTDTQVRFDGAHAVTFRRQSQLVTERGGLEQTAQQKLDFDPATEDLVIHRIAVWRDGRMRDATRTTAIDVIRRETDLDDGIITGGRTAVLRIADVRVGDTVDVAWSWRDRDPTWRGVYAADFMLGWSAPVGITRVRLIMPATLPLAIRAQNAPPTPVIGRRGTDVVREWRTTDRDPVRDDERSPAWWRPWARVSVSTMGNWGQVVRWAAPLYADKLALPAAWAAQVDATAARTRDPAARAVAALRLVQDSIRYTSISIGEGGYVPRTPLQTVANGYGDCKDKAQLLVATLARLGIEAWPALTDSDEGAALARVLPSPGAFDHVVVLARVAGRDYWLDATRTHQGGTLAGLAALSYGFALPIRAGQNRLAGIANPVPSRPTMATVDRYRHTPVGVAFDTATLFTYDEADIKRGAIADSGLAKFTRDELAFYRQIYPGVQLRGPIQVRDDRDANRLVLHERFLIPAAAAGYARTIGAFEVQGWSLRNIFKTVPRDRGAAPIELAYTINRTHRITLDTPGFRPARPDDVHSNGAAFTFDFGTVRDGDRLTLDYRLVGKAPVIAGREAAAYAGQVKALDDASWWSLDLTSQAGAIDANRIALAFLVIPLAIAWIVIAGVALAKLLREQHSPALPFVPMPFWRFALLVLATFGTYPAYWAWRHWRWARIADDQPVLPFWRALFLTLSAGPTFFVANRRASSPLPSWLGYAVAFAVIIGAMASAAVRRLVDWAPAGFIGVPLGLLHLPALAAANRANFPARVVRGARLGPLAIAALVTGATSWAAVIALLS